MFMLLLNVVLTSCRKETFPVIEIMYSTFPPIPMMVLLSKMLLVNFTVLARLNGLVQLGCGGSSEQIEKTMYIIPVFSLNIRAALFAITRLSNCTKLCALKLHEQV